MAQRLNKKLVVGLTLAGMALMVVCGMVMIMLLPAADPGPFLVQARQYEKEGNFDQAAIAYSRAADRARRVKAGSEHFNKANAYRILAGDMALKAGKVSDARNLWAMVMRDDQANETAQERILGSFLDDYRLFRFANWQSVEAEARKLCDINRTNPNPKGLGAWGLAVIKQRSIKPEKEVKENGEPNLKRAVELKKDDPDLADYLAGYYLEEAKALLSGLRPQETYQAAEARLSDAEGVYDQLKANLPADPKAAAVAWRSRGLFYVELCALAAGRLELLRRGTTVGSSESDLLRQVDDADRKALESLEQAAKLAPEDDKNLWSMGLYWVFKPSKETDPAKRKSERDEYLAKARAAYEKAIIAAPDEFEAYLRLASLHTQAGNLAAAGEVLDRRLDRGITRGTQLEYRNRRFITTIIDEAFDIRFRQAVAPTTDAKEKESLIQVLEKLRLRYANEAENREENPNAKYMQGRIFMLQGKYGPAMKIMEEANTAISGNDPRLKLQLAQLYSINNIPARAEELLRDVTRSGMSDHDGAWALLASVQMDLGKPDEALLSADRAVQLNSGNEQALRAKLRAYVAKGITGEPVNEIRKKLGIQESVAAKSVQEAFALLRTARPGEPPDPANLDRAKAKLHEALGDDPVYFPALRILALVLAPRKDDAEPVRARKAEELKAALTVALAAIDKKVNDPAATKPAPGAAVVDYKRLAASIRRLEVFTKLMSSNDEYVAEMEKIIGQEQDPYEVATGLADLYNGVGQTAKAVEQLKKACAIQPQNTALWESLFGLALVQKETWPVAEECIKTLVDLGATRAGGKFSRGRLASAKMKIAARESNEKEMQAQAAAARDAFEAALKEFPAYPDAYVWLAEATGVLGQYDAAQQALGKALEMNPRHQEATLLMYKMALARRDEVQQAMWLPRLREVWPDHELVRRAAQEEEDAHDPKAGIARREQAAQSNPKDADNLLVLADLYARDNQADKARAAYEQCRQLLPESLVVVRNYAAFLREKNPPEPAAAEQMLQQTVVGLKDVIAKATAQLMLAGHYEVMCGRGGSNAPTLDNVAAAYEAAANIHEAPDILADIGQFYVRARQPRKAEVKFRRAVEISETPELRELNRKARRVLIKTLMDSSEDRFTEIDREIADYGKKFDDGFAQMAHCDLALATGRGAEALADTNAYIGKMPQEALGFFRRGYIQYRRGEFDKAIEDLRKAESLDPRGLNYEHRRLLARCLAETNQTDLAIAELNSIIREAPIATAAARQLLELYTKLKQWGSAEALVVPRARDPKDSNRLAWANLLVKLYVQQGDAVKAIQTAREAAEAGQYQLPLLNALADLCLTVKQPREVIQFVTQKVPAELRKITAVQMRLAEAYAAAKEMPKALEIYEQLLDAAGGQFGEVQAVATSMARVVQKEGIEALNKRLAARPGDRATRFVLAVLQARSGDFEPGLQAMNALLAETTGNDDRAKTEKIVLLRQMSEMAHGRRDLPTARKLYEQLLVLEPGNYLARNNLAYLLMTEFKDPKGALEHAELAVRGLPPDIADEQRAVILDTLGWNLVLTGSLDAGLARLLQAIDLAQNSSTPLDYVLAGSYYHAIEGFFRRSQVPNSGIAQSDREEAALACRRAWQRLKTSGADDPDHVREAIQELAGKLKVDLEEQPPASQPAAEAK